MNKNTKIRIRVPKSLYESIQQEIKKEGVKHQESGQYYSDRAMKGGITNENEEQINEDIVNTIAQAVQSADIDTVMAALKNIPKDTLETIGMALTAAGIGITGMKLGKGLQANQDAGNRNTRTDNMVGTKSETKSPGDKDIKEYSMEKLSEAIKKVMENKKKKAAAAKQKEKEKAAKEKEKEAAAKKKAAAAKKK